ncbi:major facilitator superfamily domain-containing protein [Cadophora sp. MPI-SDFR-AT-0126]|nr:major facilitator superfamily domain-containing protein [Leotiomycetes sp. MPI-SDFR-AT-0126]
MDKKSSPLQRSTTVTQVSLPDARFEEYPGTRLLVDKQHLLNSEHEGNDLVLIPQPSDSPDDPLRWSSLRKYLSLGIVCLYSFMCAALTLTGGLLYGALIPEFGASVAYLNVGTAVGLLLIGISNLIWSPLAMKFGRRPVYLLSAILTVASQITGAYATSKSVYNGSRYLMGIAAGPFEQLPAITVDDQFFVHHRGFGLSWYILGVTTGSYLGPIAAGFVIQSMGWRWVLGFYAIFMGMIAIIIFFGLEETAFNRQVHSTGNMTSELPPPTSKKSYWAKVRLITILPTEKSLLMAILEPARLLLHPIVIWSGCVYGFAIAWLVVMSTSANTVFQNPAFGYNFSFTAVGLTNISPLIGGVLILYTGGAGTDRFMVWRAKRNNGIMEPESRIYSVFIGGPIMAAGLFLYGPGAAAGLHWIAPVFGMGLIGAGIPIAGEVALGYVTEAYPTRTGPASAAVITIRNIIGCAMVFASEPWIVHSGLRDAFLTMGFLCLAVFLSGILMIWQGKGCRKRSLK